MRCGYWIVDLIPFSGLFICLFIYLFGERGVLCFVQQVVLGVSILAYLGLDAC